MELSVVAKWGHNVLLVSFAVLTLVTVITLFK